MSIQKEGDVIFAGKYGIRYEKLDFIEIEDGRTWHEMIIITTTRLVGLNLNIE